jgi:hypothetical protein
MTEAQLRGTDEALGAPVEMTAAERLQTIERQLDEMRTELKKLDTLDRLATLLEQIAANTSRPPVEPSGPASASR